MERGEVKGEMVGQSNASTGSRHPFLSHLPSPLYTDYDEDDGHLKLQVQLMDCLANRTSAHELEAGGLGKTIEV